MKRLLITCSLVLTMVLSAGIVNATSIHPVRKVVGKTVTTTVATTTNPIRNTIKDIRDHLKSHGPLRNLRNKIGNLFNQNKTPDVKEVTE